MYINHLLVTNFITNKFPKSKLVQIKKHTYKLCHYTSLSSLTSSLGGNKILPFFLKSKKKASPKLWLESLDHKHTLLDNIRKY